MTVFVMKLQHKFKNIESMLSRSIWSLKKPIINHYQCAHDQWLHKLGDILLQYGIEYDTGLLPHEWEYQISKQGKISIIQKHVNQPMIHVNLSYSFPYIACVVDSQPVGIDIERISNKLDWKTLVTCLSDNEAGIIHNNQDFYNIWTMKESLNKLFGKAKMYSLEEHDVTKQCYYRQQEVAFQHFIINDFIVQIAFTNKSNFNLKRVSTFDLLSL
ncbi:4'-phosphopantetheinyl transferase superfamily protein [Staphylococcus simiae]|uniref:aureusimine biosynthesis 4'-phosphopantetheinyl transferase AusB n=1 Tax=Staphylococcus simiae TaxID=308354 RepID=UPI001A9614E5|nr:4'-phosphopantetheinyl transferase superfamily protein [Staphylococcus simiae]MBO1198875.1 4'-phosphopantetheinyl transferase superfamily protein [Staphylococcus simiae]MBO1201099.1 4'-phosphopantetheinyl transferase superfamily protein [Staphylococcus simiae]MBO1203275.1 4'-phosphopantetheinyl transferase superfamily protein [Staphylococcus simiae]MBO1210776.1 4'-phosphopantetheinyl transferase superfamily protein [Staphylococcus simiae]MBO1229437.1 4'-phosphopantetheinyl transferase super